MPLLSVKAEMFLLRVNNENSLNNISNRNAHRYTRKHACSV